MPWGHTERGTRVMRMLPSLVSCLPPCFLWIVSKFVYSSFYSYLIFGAIPCKIEASWGFPDKFWSILEPFPTSRQKPLAQVSSFPDKTGNGRHQYCPGSWNGVCANFRVAFHSIQGLYVRTALSLFHNDWGEYLYFLHQYSTNISSFYSSVNFYIFHFHQ